MRPLEEGDAEVAGLRRYLLNGGFIMLDDFWAPQAWRHVRDMAAVDSSHHPCLLNGSRMRIRQLTLRHFRNVGLAALPFVGRQQFFVGSNGQGKTNLLEAAGLVTALRSFRAGDTRLLIAQQARDEDLRRVREAYERLRVNAEVADRKSTRLNSSHRT